MKALGIILAGGNSSRMKELTEKRATAAMPVGGGYRCIDFALSNMANSHIQKVAVLTQYNSRSLNEHLSSSKWWDFGRKQGGLYVFTPTVTKNNSWWYRGTADAIYQNLLFLERAHEPYVIIAAGDGVYKMDYGKMLEFHIQKQADITIACKDMGPDEDFSRYGVVRMNEDCRITDFEEKPMATVSTTVSAGIYILRRRLLIELLEKCINEGRYDFVNDILIRYKNMKKIYGYKMEGYWSNIASVESYFKTNMDFLDKDIRKHFFREEPFIRSKVDDLPPAKYNEGSEVSNSLIASGCIVNGKIENAVVFKNSFIGKNCVIKNSIILNEVYIEDNTHIENCIVESRENLKANSYYCGEDEIKIVNEKNDRYEL